MRVPMLAFQIDLIDIDFEKELMFVNNLSEEESELLSNLLDKIRS